MPRRTRLIALSAALVYGVMGPLHCAQESYVPDNYSPEPCGGMKLIRARDSLFFVGSDSGYTYESPAHAVRLTHDFYMDSTEVTAALFSQLMGYSRPGWMGRRHPVTGILFYHIIRFCNERSKQCGLDTVYEWSVAVANAYDTLIFISAVFYEKNGFRLPTEAEWEYACRAGTHTRFYWGNDSTEDTVKQYEWYARNADSSAWTQPHASRSGTQEVALKRPNGFGLYDMTGNADEVCQDLFKRYPSNPDTLTDPTVDDPYATYGQRVIRGGSYMTPYVQRLTPSARSGIGVDELESYAISFRCVRRSFD